MGPSAASFMAALISSAVAFFSSITVRSTSDPVGTGTRKAMPSIFPSSSGMTIPRAFAAPVEVGMIDRSPFARGGSPVRVVEETLVVGEGVHRGQVALRMPQWSVEHLGHGGGAVGGARGVGDDAVLGADDVVVDAHDDGGVQGVLRGNREDHPLGAGAQVPLQLGHLAEDARWTPPRSPRRSPSTAGPGGRRCAGWAPVITFTRVAVRARACPPPPPPRPGTGRGSSRTW